MSCEKVIINVIDRFEEPIKNCKITITTVNGNNRYYTFTDKCGIAKFCLAFGVYFLKISKLGYKDILYRVVLEDRMSFNKIRLIKKCYYGGIVYGNIKECNNKNSKCAMVILYKVSEDNTITPIEYTLTDKCGIYMFFNIPPGNYIIKATK